VAHWPEFAGGHEKIPVRHFLSHQAGFLAPCNFLPRSRYTGSSADALAGAELLVEPGTRHVPAVLFGHLVAR
jgi:CubicO group peptidase (beta-lactamase class C family)